AFSAESTAPKAVEFVEAYKALYPDEVPNSNAELTYEATNIVIWALQNAEEVSREAVRDAIATMEGLEQPSGVMAMGADRNPVKGGVIMEYGADGVSHYVSSVNP
ncbi:MAG: ABC transporter substrate-binding protein, partial [Firmicutes bacterium]|nr:ABC transporter substrate-binding protein [Bacillota bacterium]